MVPASLVPLILAMTFRLGEKMSHRYRVPHEAKCSSLFEAIVIRVMPILYSVLVVEIYIGVWSLCHQV